MQEAITLLQKLAMHVHRPVRESAVRALDMSFKRYSCLLPACIPTALCALAKLPLPLQPLQGTSSGRSYAEILPALEQAMLDSASTSSSPAELSAAGDSITSPHGLDLTCKQMTKEGSHKLKQSKTSNSTVENEHV